MTKKLIYVGGGKGGTGKSIVCMALIHYLRTEFPKENILLFETDTSNPDVGRLYKDTSGVELQTAILDEKEDGWIGLVDEIDETKSKYIVINSMAASSLGIEKQGSLLDGNISAKNLDVDFHALWVMNRSKDSVLLLRKFLDVMKSAVVYPVINLFFGAPADFVFYDTNKDLHEKIAELGGETIPFPNLNDLVADKLYTDAINLENLPSRLRLGMRTVLERWIHNTKEQFDKIFKASVNTTADSSKTTKK